MKRITELLVSGAVVGALLFALACTQDPRIDPPLVGDPATADRAATHETGRLDFLLPRDPDRAYVLDSPYDPLFVGLGPFDPPYEAGDNQITVLSNVSGQMTVERTVPLGDELLAAVFSLSPDGDSALVAGVADFVTFDSRLLVVRGLREGGEPGPVIELPRCVQSLDVAPDGSWAAIGFTAFHGPMEVGLVTGLPHDPRLSHVFRFGEPGEVQWQIQSIDISLDGESVLVHSLSTPECNIPGNVWADLRVIHHPLDGAAARISAPLRLPLDPAIPAGPPFEGAPTGMAHGDALLLFDGDSALVPSAGWIKFGQLDAQIFLVRGVRSGDLEIARTLGPADGVQPSPLQLALAPDGDAAVVANLAAGSVTVIRGLSDPSFEFLTLESFPLQRPAGEPAITPDGHTLIVANGMGPVDNSIAPEATNHDFSRSTVPPAISSVRGPIRMTPFFMDSNFATPEPGLWELAGRFEETDTNEMRAWIRDAVRLADEGRGEEAAATIQRLREARRLPPDLDALARLGQRRLRRIE